MGPPEKELASNTIRELAHGGNLELLTAIRDCLSAKFEEGNEDSEQLIRFGCTLLQEARNSQEILVLALETLAPFAENLEVRDFVENLTNFLYRRVLCPSYAFERALGLHWINPTVRARFCREQFLPRLHSHEGERAIFEVFLEHIEEDSAQEAIERTLLLTEHSASRLTQEDWQALCECIRTHAKLRKWLWASVRKHMGRCWMAEQLLLRSASSFLGLYFQVLEQLLCYVQHEKDVDTAAVNVISIYERFVSEIDESVTVVVPIGCTTADVTILADFHYLRRIVDGELIDALIACGNSLKREFYCSRVWLWLKKNIKHVAVRWALIRSYRRAEAESIAFCDEMLLKYAEALAPYFGEPEVRALFLPLIVPKRVRRGRRFKRKKIAAWRLKEVQCAVLKNMPERKFTRVVLQCFRHTHDGEVLRECMRHLWPYYRENNNWSLLFSKIVDGTDEEAIAVIDTAPTLLPRSLWYQFVAMVRFTSGKRQAALAKALLWNDGLGISDQTHELFQELFMSAPSPELLAVLNEGFTRWNEQNSQDPCYQLESLKEILNIIGGYTTSLAAELLGDSGDRIRTIIKHRLSPTAFAILCRFLRAMLRVIGSFPSEPERQKYQTKFTTIGSTIVLALDAHTDEDELRKILSLALRKDRTLAPAIVTVLANRSSRIWARELVFKTMRESAKNPKETNLHIQCAWALRKYTEKKQIADAVVGLFAEGLERHGTPSPCQLKRHLLEKVEDGDIHTISALKAAAAQRMYPQLRVGAASILALSSVSDPTVNALTVEALAAAA